VLQADHPHWQFSNIIFDGQYGLANVIDIGDGAHHLSLSSVEVRRSSRDCIEMGAPSDVTIEDSLIHHCLAWNSDDDEPDDAHGITGGSVQDLTIRDTEIHTFSGDGIHFDSARRSPGWNNITIDGCDLWLEPLSEDINGFPAGSVTGLNAVTTQTYPDGERASLTIEDTTAWGFRDGIGGTTQAAFLFKENVDISVRRVHVHSSASAFRIRGATDGRPLGPWVQIENAMVHDVDTAIRYEDGITNLNIFHATFGLEIGNMLVAIDSEDAGINIRNSLFSGEELPPEADGSLTNQTATTDDFVDAEGGDYHLLEGSEAIDAGIEITGIDTDLDGRERLVGEAPDLGAYEYGAESWDTGTADDTGVTDDTGFVDGDDPDGGSVDDTGTDEAGPGVPGVGAAEHGGEKGGCGCSTSRRPAGDFIVLLLALLAVRPKRRSSP
jgi:hypothetical protein